MTISRVQVAWSGATVVGGGLSTFYFNSAVGTPAQQVAAVGAYLGATEDRRSTSITWATLADVASINEATGQLTGLATVTPLTGVGTVATEVMPPIVQVLIRLLTSTIANGRLVRGRLFIPGTCEGDSNSGTPSTTSRTDYDAAGAALIADANTEWRLWSRTHGIAPDVTTATMWNRYASLRSRRD